MNNHLSRRRFLKDCGLGAASLPFICNLPSLAFANTGQKKQRLVVVFSPDGTIPDAFWPDDKDANLLDKVWPKLREDEVSFKEILEPLTPFKDQTLILKGLCDKVRGDGDNHMRGMGCLLTGIELFPGNIQGGSHTPAGWSKGISLDQELKNFLQSNPATRTRFGSLEFGVMVPDRADTWTRMSYTGPNQPVAPIDDPYQMFQKLYGRLDDQESLKSVLDEVQMDLAKIRTLVSTEDRDLLDAQTTFVREMERELKTPSETEVGHAVPELEKGVKEENDNIPKITQMQIELLVNSFAADFTRIATFQFTNSVGQPRMRWLGIEEGQHELSHKPDSDKESQDKLIKINKWYCEQIAHLAKRLAETPEPGGNGSMLDNTTIVWTNELGKGNSHTLDNIPFVLVGGGLGYRTGRSLFYPNVPHNRLLMSLSHSFGHHVDSFGNSNFCGDGPLPALT